MQKIKIIEYGSKTCAPCQDLKMKIEVWLKHHPEVDFEYITIEEEPELCAQVGVLSAPTLKIFIGDKEFISESGCFSLERVFDKLDHFVSVLSR